jgi:quercetin dioxygenase-like cupin family protein
MRPVFSPGTPFEVRDKTRLSPFLNPADSKSRLDPALLDTLGFSLAIGYLEPGKTSLIHVHPIVTQVTFVVAGRLTVRLRQPGEDEVHTWALKPDDAVLTLPGAFLQLENGHDEECRVLYIVGPPYVFVDGEYDDSDALIEDWQQLEDRQWRVYEPSVAKQYRLREAMVERLRRRKHP